MIKQHGLFQVESNDKHFIIRITADFSKWRFIPADLVAQIKEATEKAKADGLTPAPFGTDAL